MASFEDKAKEFEKLLDLFEKYASEGKYSSMNFRGKKQQLASLMKRMDKEDETQNKIFRNLESRYAALYALKNNSNEALANLDKKAQKAVYIKKQELKDLHDINEVYKNFADSSDVHKDSIEVAKTIKGNQKEQEVAKRLIKTYVYLEQEKENILKKKNERYKKLNKELIDAVEVEKLSDKILERIVTQAKMGKRGKKNSFVVSNPIVANVYDFLIKGQGQGLSEGEIARRILNSQNDINLRGPMSKTKTAEDNITRQYIGSSNTSFPANTGTTSRRVTLKVANRENLENFFKRNFGNMNFKNKGDGKKSPKKDANNYGQFGGYWDEFKQILVNTEQANLAKLGYPDLTDPNDDLGLRYATLKQVITADFLPKHIQQVLGIENYNKNGKKGRKPKVYQLFEDIEKSAAKINKFSYIGNASNGDHLIKTGKGKTLRIHSMNDLAKYRDLLGNDIKISDLNNFSAFHTLFPGLALNKETVNKLKAWNRIIGNSGVEMNLSNSEVLNKNKSLTPEELDGVLNGTSYGKVQVSSANSKTKESNTPTPSTVGGVSSVVSFNSSDILKAIGGVQYRLDEIIKLLGGDISTPAIAHSKHGSATDLIEGEEESAPEAGKSAYQVNQENNSKVRTRHRSFISMLIPEIAKILRKNPVWDAVKLLLFKLGATHPKTAAALLLGGAPLALGAARLGARALLGLPGWASGRSPLFRSRLAKAGTFGGPIANTKMWVSDVNSNFFSNNGVYASLKNYQNTTIPRRLARIERLEKLGQSKIVFVASPDGTLRATTLGKRGQNLLQATKASLTPGGKLLGYTKAAWEGLAWNAKFNWAKYSKQGRLGNLATLGRAAKGIPGLSAIAELLGDIPNITTAAQSGKKGALNKQLWSTGGAALGAFAGAFLGPAGLLLGPLIGRGLGQGIGPRMKYLLRAIEDLGSAFSGLIQGIRDSRLGDALKFCGDAIVKFSELVGRVLVGTITTLIKAFGWLCDVIRWVVDEKYRNEQARGGDGKKQSQYVKDLEDPDSDAYKKIGKSQEFYKKLESTLGIGSTHDIYGRNYGKIHSKFMKERTAALIKEGKDKEDAEAQATKEFKDAYNSAYAYIVNQSKKAAEGKLNNISTYGNAAGTSVDGLTRYSRNASGGISKDTNGNLVYMKDLKLVGTVPKDNSKPYIPVEHVGDIRYLDNTLNGMSLGEVTYSSNMGGAHNSGKNSHYNGKKVDVVTGKPLSVEQYTRLYNEGWFGSGTGAIGYEYYSGQKAVVTPAQYAKLMAEGKVVMAGNNHYDFGYLSAHGKSISASATGGVIKGEAVTGVSTETKVFQQTKDDVRSALLDFAKATNAKNKKDTIDRIVWDPTDVTGSLGCWGIVQLNNTGQMAY